MSGRWSSVPLGDVVELKRGYDLPRKDREDGPYPVYSSSGISGCHCMPAVEGPCVITGRYGTIGEVYFSPGACWPLNTSLFATDFKGNSPRFVYYLLKNFPWQEFATASAVPGINRNHINGYLVNIPDFSTQQAIASVLGALDDKIALNTRKNVCLEQLARTLFEEWLSEAQTELLPLCEVAETNPETYSPREGWPVVQYLDTGAVTSNLFDTPVTIDTSIEKLPSRARRKVKTGDVLYSTVRPANRHYGLVINPPENLLVSTGFCVVRDACGLGGPFLYLLLTQDSITETLGNIAEQSTSAYPSIRPSDIENLLVSIPNANDVELLNNQLVCIFALIAKNHDESIELAALRDALLPKLMSGEVDVSGVELP